MNACERLRQTKRAPKLANPAAIDVMLAKLLLVLIRIYQLTLSKLFLAVFGPVCRFEPSCSRYAAACIATHGAIRGSLLSAKRLSKCHPFHPGGYDPPPPPRTPRTSPSPASLLATSTSDDETCTDERHSAHQKQGVGATAAEGDPMPPVHKFGFSLSDDGAIEKPH